MECSNSDYLIFLPNTLAKEKRYFLTEFLVLLFFDVLDQNFKIYNNKIMTKHCQENRSVENAHFLASYFHIDLDTPLLLFK